MAEDILRIYGYNNVEFSQTLHSSLSYKKFSDSSNQLRELISNQLTSVGFNEILNNSLTAESYYAELSDNPKKVPVKLLNPLSNDLSVMRMTLLFGGLETISHNINRRNPDLMLYEFGNVYSDDSTVEPTAENPIAPYTENEHLALWFTENEHPLFGSAVSISTRSGKNLGFMGLVAKKWLKMCDIKQEVVFAELDWTSIVKLAVKKKITYTPLPRTQPVKRDLALLIDHNVTMAQIDKVVRDSEKRLLRDVTLFDVYEGKNLEPGKKSYAIAITLQDARKLSRTNRLSQSWRK